MSSTGEVGPSRAWVLGVGLTLVLLTISPAAQAAMLRGVGVQGPCVSMGSGGVNVGECNHGGGGTGSSSNNHPAASPSEAFPSTDASAVGQDARVLWTVGDDIRVSWTFDEDQVDANVAAFHIQRGLDPALAMTMDRVGTVSQNVDTYFDEDAMASGDVWYVVTAELANGESVDSQPFRVNSIQT